MMHILCTIAKILIGLFVGFAVLAVFALAAAVGLADEQMGYKGPIDPDADRIVTDDEATID